MERMKWINHARFVRNNILGRITAVKWLPTQSITKKIPSKFRVYLRATVSYSNSMINDSTRWTLRVVKPQKRKKGFKCELFILDSERSKK